MNFIRYTERRTTVSKNELKRNSKPTVQCRINKNTNNLVPLVDESGH